MTSDDGTKDAPTAMLVPAEGVGDGIGAGWEERVGVHGRGLGFYVET